MDRIERNSVAIDQNRKRRGVNSINKSWRARLLWNCRSHSLCAVELECAELGVVHRDLQPDGAAGQLAQVGTAQPLHGIVDLVGTSSR